MSMWVGPTATRSPTVRPSPTAKRTPNSPITDKAVTAGAHRTRPLADTIAAILPLLPAMGISRVANVTGLDFLGIPVAMSMRPASLGLSVQQGKGLSLEAAMASAIMESVESFAAEQAAPSRVML